MVFDNVIIQYSLQITFVKKNIFSKEWAFFTESASYRDEHDGSGQLDDMYLSCALFVEENPQTVQVNATIDIQYWNLTLLSDMQLKITETI